MLTRCPTCQTTFRVTAEQLMARKGRVRCGHCQGVFNALESLIEEATPAAAAANEPVAMTAIPGPAINVAPETPPERQPEVPSSTVSEPLVEPPPIEPVDVETAVVEAEGEEVAEPEVEYVEIAALEPGEDEDLTDVLTSPDADFEDGFGETAIDLENANEPTAAAAEQSPDDQFTKTVVGFTWYVEPEPGEEPPITEPPAEDYTRTVIQSLRTHEADVAPQPVAEPQADEFTRTVIAPWRIAAQEVASEPAATAVAGDLAHSKVDEASIDEPEAAASPAGANTIDFAKTVVQSIRMFEPEFEPAPTEEAAAHELEETATQPLVVSEDEITTLVGDEPLADEFAFPHIEPLAIDLSGTPPELAEPPAGTGFAKTVIDRVSFIEHESEPESLPAQTADEDDFAKTVVQSIRMFEPEIEPTPAEESVSDEFETTVVQPRRVDERETTTAVVAEPPRHELTFPTIESLALDDTEAEPEPVDESGEKQFTNTMVDLESVAHRSSEDAAELEFDLAPIDDIHVEEVEEKPSIVDLSIATPTAFPTLEPLSESDELPSHETANAILDQLAASTPPQGATIAHEAIAEPAPTTPPEPPPKAPLELEEFLANAFASEPTTDPNAEAAAEIGPEAEAIPELQELPARRRWPWVLGGVVAVCLLAAQAIVHYRVELSVKIPGSKPALQAMCDVLDCKLPLPSQIDLIGIETSDLSPGPEGAGHLQLAATLRNRAPFSQTWPHLELTLTDGADKALVRRTLGPADYLPPARKADVGFPGRSEQQVHLDLKAPGVPAVGYRLYVFYP